MAFITHIAVTDMRTSTGVTRSTVSGYEGELSKHLLTTTLTHVGPVFRYSPNGLSFNTSTAMKTIHGAKANCQKSKLYTAYTPLPGAWSIVNAIPKQVHARKKRILSQAFSDRAVKDMEDYILGHTEKFVRLLRDAAKTASDVDMSLHIDDLIMDIFSGLCFGKSYGIQGSKGERTAREMINTVAKHHYIVGTYPVL